MPRPLPRTDRLLDHFLSLVRIDSPSFEEHAIAEVLAQDLRALGFTTRNDQSGPNGTGNLIGFLDGVDAPTIGLCGHMDTVEPGRGVKPIVNNGTIRSDGTTILGADCKAGLAVIIEALRVVIEDDVPHPPIEVIFTYGEERGHAGSKTLDVGALQSEFVIVADGVGPPGTLIGESPTYDSFVAVIHGVAAHAGLEPEKGISAIQVAAEAIRTMPLGRLDEVTTSNIGFISGGTARNAVPDRVELHGEARSLDPRRLEAAVAALRLAVERACDQMDARSEFTVTREYTGYRMTADDPAIALALRAVDAAGLTPHLSITGGGSDANTFNERGLSSVALGIGMEQPHTLGEWIRVEDMAASSALVINLLVGVAKANEETT